MWSAHRDCSPESGDEMTNIFNSFSKHQINTLYQIRITFEGKLITGGSRAYLDPLWIPRPVQGAGELPAQGPGKTG